MHPGRWITQLAIRFPRAVTLIMVLTAAILAVLAGAPSLAPQTFPMLHPVAVDTDPENMLNADEPVRLFHRLMRKALDLNDIVVLGVVNEEHPEGVFNPESLKDVYALTEFAKNLRGEALGLDDPNAGVIRADIIAPSTVDNIEQGGPGEVRFEWLMAQPPETQEEATAIRDNAQHIPFLNGTLVSEDGKALAVYLPITSKDISYRVYSALNEKIAELKDAGSHNEYYITGLPVAEDVFGVQMFIQMAISAPLAMLVIFLLMLYFFRKLVLIISPMIIAMVAVICTMGLLVVTGNTIHIMSSMIPIFIMPIAVLDSIHILSEFFDRYQETKDRKATISRVMDDLFTPMLYTSLTSTAGFASLALTPIPPVQIFGMFVAFGVMLSWLLTVTFIPAYVMLLSEKRLEGFGAVHAAGEDEAPKNFTGRVLQMVGRFTYQQAKLIVAAAVIILVIAVYGISQIQVNDNPTKWFEPSHPIRVADRVLNEHFGGTYMAYLALSPKGERPDLPPPAQSGGTAQPFALEGPGALEGLGLDSSEPAAPEGLGGSSGPALPAGLGGGSEPGLPAGLGGDSVEPPSNDEETAKAPAQEQALEIFKDPEVARYIAGLEDRLLETGVVGKANSVTDIIKTVHRELIDGSPEAYRVPDSRAGVAQCLTQYQSSHRPKDLWHFITPDYRHTSIWVQLKSGDNKDMERVVQAIDAYVAEHPLDFTIDGEKVTLEHQWFGKTYINVVWQDKMVAGMRDAFLGSFLVVLLMMILLFRSGLWGLLSMIPLTLTIASIYGVIGLIGKDYDMPVAVLSSLTLGLAVDFAIHFLARSQAMRLKYGTWKEAHTHAFGEPANAITRNVIVIAVGFLPLLFAPLVPYQTVGIFLASILLVSGFATLLLLAALIRLMEPVLFPESHVAGVSCKCSTCFVSAVVAVMLVWVNVHHFFQAGWTIWTTVSAIVLPLIFVGCCVVSRRRACGIKPERDQT